MKNLILVLLVIMVSGCKSTHINKALSSLDKKYTTETTNCIPNATCQIDLIPNANLIIKQDEFENSYIDIEKGHHTVIRYLLKRSAIPNTADSNYSEIIYLEIDNFNKTLILNDKELQQIKMTYARLCNCKGTSGYFKVTNGHLKLHLKKNELTLITNFNVEKIPQLLTNINEKVILEGLNRRIN